MTRPKSIRPCASCRVELPLSSFERVYVNGKPHGWHPRCYSCRALLAARYMAHENPDDPTGETVLIRLTKNQNAIIDRADAELVTQFRWSALESPWTFYALRMDKGKAVLLHRFLLNAPDGVEVDHIDFNGLNCSRFNIRLATSAENHHNRLIHKSSSNKFKGIVFCSDSGRWAARISIGNRTRTLGRFDTPEEAALVYDDAVRAVAGSFGRYNFPRDDELSALG